MSFTSGASYQISGPTGAMTAILVTVVSRQSLQGMFVACFLAGIILLLCGIFKIGKLVELIPTPVVIGFAFIFLFGFVYNKSPEDQEKIDSDFYISLVELSQNNPQKFQKEYKRLIGHGTRYIILLFTLIILSLEGIIAIGVASEINMGAFGLFAAGLVAIAYTIIKSLYIKSFPVEGYEITIKSSPETIKTVEEARIKTNSPILDKIIIVDGANCGVIKNPLGFFQKSENVLFVGLHLLMLLTPKELESIYIHEFAHIYNKDTHISNKINRAIIRWGNILENLGNRGIMATTLLKSFAENYIAKMQLYSAADSKRKEIMADKEAAKFSGKEMYAKASMKIELIEYYFNLPVGKSNFDFRTFDTAPKNAHDLLIDSFLNQFEQNKDEWKAQILKRISNKADTHPSYKERMAEIGVDSFDFDISFTKSNLPEVLKITEDLNAEWHKNMSESWEEYTADYKKSQQLIKDFEISEDNNKNVEYAMALEELAKTEEALNIYESILEKDKNFAPALFRSGLIYINRNEGKGLELIKSAMEIDYNFINAGLEVIALYLDRNGLKEKKEELRGWALEKHELYNEKTEEMNYLNTNDKFVKAKLTEQQLNDLKEKLEAIDSIKKAYIVTKELKNSEDDLLVLAVTSKQKLGKLLSKGEQLHDVDKIEEVLSGLNVPYFILDLQKNLAFFKKITEVENSRIINR